MTDQIYYWAHMLDESKHDSYYSMYMKSNPDDKATSLANILVEQFVDSLRKDHLSFEDCLANGSVHYDKVEAMQKKIKHHYVWRKIRASTYAAIISRLVALLSRSGNQQFNEADEIQFDDVSRLVSRRTVEDCLDIMCHNTNVLAVNNLFILDDSTVVDVLHNNGIKEQPRKLFFRDEVVEDFYAFKELYKAWAAYDKGTSEPYVCDSDNGPEELKKVLDSVEYSASTIDLIVALNRALDVVHFRSDLAKAFIEGGQQTCALVSNLPDKFVI